MRWATALVVLAATAAFPAPAAADEGKAAARALFSQGVKLVEAGDATGALAAFRAAYDRSPSYKVLYNIAQLCARLGNPVAAIRTYEQFLADGGSEVGNRRRNDVEAELTKLRRNVATVAVTVNRAGAEVTLDDAASGRAPLSAPLLVTIGSHRLVASFDGRSVDRTVKVSGGEAAAVDLVIPDPPLPPEPPHADARAHAHQTGSDQPPHARPASSTERHGVPVVPWVVTGGFAFATAVSAVLAESRYNTFIDKRQSFPVSRAELDDAQGSARTLLLFTGALGVATVASAAVAAYFTFFTPNGGGPRVGVGPGTLAVVGRLP